jgi:hypothetical protein
MWLYSDHVKVYGERVDGEEVTADIVDGEEVTADIYILSYFMSCKSAHKNVSSP